ncbi:hypothetical protein ACHAXT_001149 [Thalassiosira profunda]
MPPRKRKAASAADGDDAAISPTPKTAKKSKKEQLAEARARARAWHDKRNAPAESTAGSPAFSAGKSSPAKTTPSKAAAGSAARKRRTPTRKSAGTSTATRSPARAKKEGAPAKRSRRTSAGAAASPFEFKSPAAATKVKNAEEEGEEDQPTFEFGSANKRDADEMEAEEQKPSASKKKKEREEGRAKIQALRAKRRSQGLKVSGPLAQEGRRKGPPETLGSPDPPSAAAAASVAASASARMGSPDPPAAAAAASAADNRKPPARAPKPPPSVAGLFKQSKKNAAHRPGMEKFDPNNPFPAAGYKLPTAAYCGCGPTPGSTTASARGDVCATDIDAAGKAARSGSYIENVGGGTMPAKPGPPGRTGDGPPVPPVAAPQNDPGALRLARQKALSMLGLARDASNDRRRAMGIPSAQTGATVGVPPPANQPADPPMADSRPTSYTATLRKFRQVGGGTKKATEAAETTVAGENTSEAGDANASASHEETAAESDKPVSAFKKGCLTLFSLFKYLMLLQLAFGAVWVVANYAPSGNASDHLSESKDAAQEGVPGCFLDYPVQHSYAEVDDGGEIEGCQGTYKQCPQWGRCRGGEIVHCDDEGGLFEGVHRFVPNAKGTACVPSPEAVKLMKEIQDTLVGMTVAQTCGSGISGADAVALVEPFPLFSLEKVAEKGALDDYSKTVMPKFLLWLSPAFDDDLVRFGALSGDAGDDLDAVGLGDGVSPNSLPLPRGCTLKLMWWELLGYLASSAMALVRFSVANAWHLAVNYPIYVSVTVVGGLLVRKFLLRRRHRRKVNELFEIVLEATYDRLAEAEGHDGYASLILRDEVGYDRYPNSWKDRRFINEHVWKRVELELRSDNRVRKFRKTVNGKPDQQHFDLAIQSKHSRRRSRSLGPFGRKRNDDPGEPEVAQKRDP